MQVAPNPSRPHSSLSLPGASFLVRFALGSSALLPSAMQVQWIPFMDCQGVCQQMHVRVCVCACARVCACVRVFMCVCV